MKKYLFIILLFVGCSFTAFSQMSFQPTEVNLEHLMYPSIQEQSMYSYGLGINTSGDYLKKSGILGLSAIGVAFAGSGLCLWLYGIDVEYEYLIGTGCLFGAVSLGCVVGGLVCLIKAGKESNYEHYNNDVSFNQNGLVLKF